VVIGYGVILMNQKYQTLLADPPWNIGTMQMGRVRPNARLPYKRMKTYEICQLGIFLREYLADKCNLFLWATHTFLPDALWVTKAWGFEYHCLLTWDKTNGRPCFGFMRKTEFVVYGYRGGITVNQRGKYIPTLFTEKLTTHSTKPQILYELLESNTPAPRLELFARKKRLGWDCWGNEVDSDIDLSPEGKK